MPEKKTGVCVDCGTACTRRAKRCAICEGKRRFQDETFRNKMNDGRVREDTINKISNSRKQWFQNPENHKKFMTDYLVLPKPKYGSASHLWKGGLTSQNDILRSSERYTIWRKAVFERDNYICQNCKIKTTSNYLHAHHIKEFAKYPELRFEVSNGITLCPDCHTLAHGKQIRKKKLK